MKKSFSLILFLSLVLASCGNKSADEIQKSTETGVVLIQNSSYYEIVTPDGESIYFSYLDADGNLQGLATNKDSIEQTYSYGTGFFVSQDGKIATNSHVVSKRDSDKEINQSITKITNSAKQYYAYLYNEAYEEYQQLAYYAREAHETYDYAQWFGEYYDYPYTPTQYDLMRDVAEAKLEDLRATYQSLDNLRASDCEIKYHNDVSIAYNNTFVTSEKDFIPCVVTKTDENHDLAIVQLKDKKTPQDRYVFTIPEEDPLTKYSTMEELTKKIKEDKNSKLFMSGFNLGPVLAITNEGIKSQFNSGEISQKQEDKLMYSIPALQGSSGSPVVNLQGQLVAINFAGINGTQNFNYGIRVRYLRDLLGDY